MNKIIFGLLLVTSFAFSQDTTADVNQDGWKKSGTFSFIGNQATFNNWLAGGQSSLSGNILVNYDFNYKKGDWSLDNKIMAGYGITKLKEADIQKSDDRIEFNSLLGKKASGLWFYSAFFNFKTQLDTGLDPDTQTVRISHFFSPAFFQFGPGMMWKKSDNLKFNIAPLTSKLIIVHDEFTQGGLTSFGVETGETSRYELGASLSGYYKFNAMKNVSFENIVSLYSNYLEDPQNVDLNYQLNVVMSINKHLTTNLTFQTIYDDNAFRGFQTRQNIGLGVNYGF
ncbi:DUF3078 domain-containing protein [uncultured Flavobacterium sp.]|uniref:DUF3078 domain-containing protein n=1 Tax=uncultured Flavobacterium sp. TaxID=165435 RepID=UPI0030CA3E67